MERVIRVRGAYRDENDDPVAPEPDKTLSAFAVAPGASAHNIDRGRNGATVAYTVYFVPVRGDLLKDGDKLRVRGTLCDIVIQDWRSPRTSRKGLEILCSAGRG